MSSCTGQALYKGCPCITVKPKNQSPKFIYLSCFPTSYPLHLLDPRHEARFRFLGSSSRFWRRRLQRASQEAAADLQLVLTASTAAAGGREGGAGSGGGRDVRGAAAGGAADAGRRGVREPGLAGPRAGRAAVGGAVREGVGRPRLLGAAAPRRRAPARRLPPPARRLRPGPAAVRPRLREVARRADAGTGEDEGGAVDGARAQVVSLRPEELRKRGLEEHFAQLRADEDADAGGQPRAEVLHQAQLRGGLLLEHPRHHHSSPDRRPASLVAQSSMINQSSAPAQRGNGAVLSAIRHQVARRAERALQFAEPGARDAVLRHGLQDQGLQCGPLYVVCCMLC